MLFGDKQRRDERQKDREATKDMSFTERMAYHEAKSQDKKVTDRTALIQQAYPDAHHIAFGLRRLAYVAGDWLIIEPLSARKSQKKGGKRLKVSTLMAVKYKDPGLRRGFVRFDQSGQPQQIKQYVDQDSEALNENVVDFDKGHKEQFEALRDYIESLL